MKLWYESGKVDFEKSKETAPSFYKLLSEAHKSQGSEYWKIIFDDLTKLWLNDTSYPGEGVTKIEIPTLILQADRDEVVPISEAIDLISSIKG